MTRRASSGVTRRRSPSAASETGTTPRSATASSSPAPQHRLGEHVAVVPARAEHDLEVQLETGRRQPLEHARASRPPPAPSGGRGRRRPRRAATRRAATAAAPRCAPGRASSRLRQRHEVAVQERQAVVVVLDRTAPRAGRRGTWSTKQNRQALRQRRAARRRGRRGRARCRATRRARGVDDQVERMPVAQDGEPERAVGGGSPPGRGRRAGRPPFRLTMRSPARSPPRGGRVAGVGHERRRRRRAAAPLTHRTRSSERAHGGLDLLVRRRGPGRDADAAGAGQPVGPQLGGGLDVVGARLDGARRAAPGGPCWRCCARRPPPRRRPPRASSQAALWRFSVASQTVLKTSSLARHGSERGGERARGWRASAWSARRRRRACPAAARAAARRRLRRRPRSEPAKPSQADDLGMVALTEDHDRVARPRAALPPCAGRPRRTGRWRRPR